MYSERKPVLELEMARTLTTDEEDISMAWSPVHSIIPCKLAVLQFCIFLQLSVLTSGTCFLGCDTHVKFCDMADIGRKKL